MRADEPSLHLLSGMIVGGRSLRHLTALPPQQQAVLCRLASEQGLGPYLYFVLKEHDGWEQLTQEAQQSLVAAYGQSAGYNFLAIETALSWQEAFTEAGIEAVWLKGLPLSLTVYPSPELRPMVDIDVLVRRRQLPEALALVEHVSGAEPVMLNPSEDIHAVFNLGPAGLVKMELHWGLIAPEDSLLAPPLEWFHDQSLTTDVDGGRLTMMQPEAHLLYLCAHAELGHGEAQFKLVRYLDIHLLVCGAERFNWEMFLEQAVACRWTFAAERALMLAQRFFDTPLPESLLPEIQRRRPEEEDLSFVLHMQRPGTRWNRTQERLRSLPPRRRLRMLLALLVPPPQYIRWRYRVQRDWQLPFYYVYRWLDAAAEMLGLGSGHRASTEID